MGGNTCLPTWDRRTKIGQLTRLGKVVVTQRNKDMYFFDIDDVQLKKELQINRLID